jgi:hypothetical protein
MTGEIKSTTSAEYELVRLSLSMWHRVDFDRGYFCDEDRQELLERLRQQPSSSQPDTDT